MKLTSPPALTSTTVNIPLLAIDAANELDEMQHGRLKESASAKKLAAILTHSFTNREAPSELTVKSGTVAVFCNALESLDAGGVQTNNFGDVIAAALKYAKELSPKNRSKDNDALEDAKHFCIALAKAAAGYRESVVSAQIRNRWS
jgi:hypothetical protein